MTTGDRRRYPRRWTSAQSVVVREMAPPVQRGPSCQTRLPSPWPTRENGAKLGPAVAVARPEHCGGVVHDHDLPQSGRPSLQRLNQSLKLTGRASTVTAEGTRPHGAAGSLAPV